MKNIKKYYFIIGLLILGFISGIVFIYFITDMDKLIVKNEISDYIRIINKDDFNYLDSLFKSFLENIIFLFIIWSSGFIFILLPISYFLIFYKGFLLGFLLSILVYIYKLKGIILFLGFVIPYEVLFILVLIITLYIIKNIAKKYFKAIYKNKNYDLNRLTKIYFLLLVILIIISIILSFVEVYINYYIIKLIL